MAAETVNEKKDVEEYLKFYCLEDCLDEIVNKVVVERPKNPYLAISKGFETKTLPEIIDISLLPVLIGSQFGVKASVSTNISTFSAVVSYFSEENVAIDSFKDYGIIQNKIRDAVADLDPTDLAAFDTTISKLSGIDPAESLALSIACCRAGAKQKGLECFQFIAGLAGLTLEELSIPVPVITVISKIVPFAKMVTQDITLTPLKAQTLQSALESLWNAQKILTSLEALKINHFVSSAGCRSSEIDQFSKAVQIVYDALLENNVMDLRPGLFHRASLLQPSKDPENPDYFAYLSEGEQGIAYTGTRMVDDFISLWQECEIITIDEVLAEDDAPSLSTLKSRLGETIYDLKNAGKAKYCMAGIGKDESCHLQVLLDGKRFAAITDFEQFGLQMAHNTVKLELSRFSSVTEAIEVCKTARKVDWQIIVAASNSTEYPETSDTFISDLAVGLSAGQLMAGGLLKTEFSEKYNRLLEIQRQFPNIPFVGARFRKPIMP